MGDVWVEQTGMPRSAIIEFLLPGKIRSVPASAVVALTLEPYRLRWEQLLMH